MSSLLLFPSGILHQSDNGAVSLAAMVNATDLAMGASVLVALLSATMAYLGYRSYQATHNPRLPFVILAFVIFTLKSLFVVFTVSTHVVLHDTIEFVSAMFDVVIVLLLFMPFVMPKPR